MVLTGQDSSRGAFRMKLEGANPNAKVEALDKLPASPIISSQRSFQVANTHRQLRQDCGARRLSGNRSDRLRQTSVNGVRSLRRAGRRPWPHPRQVRWRGVNAGTIQRRPGNPWRRHRDPAAQAGDLSK